MEDVGGYNVVMATERRNKHAALIGVVRRLVLTASSTEHIRRVIIDQRTLSLE